MCARWMFENPCHGIIRKKKVLFMSSLRTSTQTRPKQTEQTDKVLLVRKHLKFPLRVADIALRPPEILEIGMARR